MLGLKKVLSFGVSSLVAFGGVSLANDEPKLDVAQVTGEVKGILELVSEKTDTKSNNVDDKVKAGAQKILDMLKEFKSKDPKDVENIVNISKMINDVLGNVSSNDTNKDLEKEDAQSADVKTNEVAPIVEKKDSNDGAKAKDGAVSNNEGKETKQDTKVEKTA